MPPTDIVVCQWHKFAALNTNDPFIVRETPKSNLNVASSRFEAIPKRARIAECR